MMTTKQDVCKANQEQFNISDDNYHEEKFFKSHQEFLEKNVQEILTRLGRDDIKIIDIGCGTGILTKIIYKRTKNSKIFCLDISEKMLLRLKNQLNPGDVKRSKFICGDALEYFKKTDERFDLITVSGALHHIFDYLDVIDASSKRLNEKGIFFMAGEPLPKKKYNYYLDQTFKLWDRGIHDYRDRRLKQIAYLVYAPFNFLSPIVNHRDLKPLKDRLLHGERIDFEKAQLVEYWGYERGLDLDKIKAVFIKNHLSIVKYSGTPIFKTEFFNRVQRVLKSNSSFALTAVKK